MARIRLLDEEAGAALEGTLGPEARRAFAHRPQLGSAVGLLNAAVERSALPPRLHEVVRYRVAELNDCFR